jgi:hypothetical protein
MPSPCAAAAPCARRVGPFYGGPGRECNLDFLEAATTNPVNGMEVAPVTA